MAELMVNKLVVWKRFPSSSLLFILTLETEVRVPYSPGRAVDREPGHNQRTDRPGDSPSSEHSLVWKRLGGI